MIELRDIYKNGEVYKNTQPSNSIIPRYEDYAVTEARANNNRNFSYWHPSTIGQCGLKNILDLYDVPSNNYQSMRQIEILKNGHMVHRKFQTAFGIMGIMYGYWKCLSCNFVIGKDSGNPYGSLYPSDCPNCHNPLMSEEILDKNGNVAKKSFPLFEYEELQVRNDELNIKGNTDGVLKLSPEHEFQVIDFKTCSNYVFANYLEKSNKPLSYHVIQLNAYMWLLNLNSGYIFYENRDKMRHKEFLVRKDEYLISRIINQIKYLNELVKLKRIPKMNDPNLISTDIGPAEMQCAGYPDFPPCKYYHKCFKCAFEAKGGNGIYHGFIKI